MIDPNTFIDARRAMTASHPKFERRDEDAAEGGCGVVGLACEIPVAGRHLFDSLEQMRNRGNGKGGGVAMVGLDPDQFGTDRETLDSTYLYAIAYLNNEVRSGVEALITEAYNLHHTHEMPTLPTWQQDLSALGVTK
jgi:glutamate synthase domain-containing protein 1